MVVFDCTPFRHSVSVSSEKDAAAPLLSRARAVRTANTDFRPVFRLSDTGSYVVNLMLESLYSEFVFIHNKCSQVGVSGYVFSDCSVSSFPVFGDVV